MAEFAQDLTDDDYNEWMMASFGVGNGPQPMPFRQVVEQDPYGEFAPGPGFDPNVTEMARQRGPFGPDNPAFGPSVQPEVRSANTPFGDMVAQGFGPEAGQMATQFDQGIQQVAPIAREFTGVPNAQRGIEASAQGFVEGDPVQAIGGAGQAALSALPYGAGRFAMATVPRAIGTTTAATVGPMAASGALTPPEARAGSRKLDMLYQDRASLMTERDAARDEMDLQASTGRGPKYKRAAAKYRKMQSRLDGLDKRIQKMEYRESPEFKARQPFRERYPEVASQLPAAGMGLAAGVPFVLRGTARAGSFMPGSKASRMARATRRTENAVASENPLQAARGAREINALMPSQGRLGRAASELGKPLSAAGTGGALAAEAQMFPEQYDYFNLPPDSEGYQHAKETLADYTNWMKRGAFGLALGLSGYKAGGALPGRSPDVSRAKAAASMTDPSMADDIHAVRRNLGAVKGKLQPSRSPQLQPDPAPISGPRTPAGGGPAGSGQGQAAQKGTRSVQGQGSGSRPNAGLAGTGSFRKSHKEEIAIQYAKNGGKLSQKQAEAIAKDVAPEKVKEFLEKVRRFARAGMAPNKIAAAVKRGDIRSLATGTIGVGASYNALHGLSDD